MFQRSNIPTVFHWHVVICPFSVAEFPAQSSIKGVAEQGSGTIQNLVRLSVPYSACSSFAALSGNSDLEMSSDGQEVTVAAAAIGQERNENSDGRFYFMFLVYSVTDFYQ